MKVLIITNMYPGRNRAVVHQGVFVKEQVDFLSALPDVECELYFIDGFKGKFNYLKAALDLYFIVRRSEHDVVHAHYGLSALFVLVNPFVKKWDRVLLTLHGGDIQAKQGNFVQNFLTRLVVKRVGRTITLNEKMDSLVTSAGGRSCVIPCGVDDRVFKSSYSASRVNQIVFPGAKWRAVKNFKLFDSVIQSYKKIYGDVSIVEIDGMTRDEVSTVLSTSKAMLMTSISEGSPQIVKEALCSDLPIVSTNVGDVAMVLGSTKGTRLFNFSDAPEDVAVMINDAIDEAVHSPNARRKRIYEVGLLQEQIVSRLLKLYREVSSA